MESSKIIYNINNSEPFLLTFEARLSIIEYFKQNMPNFLLLKDIISKAGYMELSYTKNSIEILILYSRAYLEFTVFSDRNNIDVLNIDRNLKEIKFCTPSNLAYLMHFFKINFSK